MHIDPALKEDLKQYLLNKLHNREKPQVIIRAPYRMEEADLQALTSRIELLEQADITTVVDSEILAGFIIEFGSSVIDLSLNTELQTLEQLLYETA